MLPYTPPAITCEIELETEAGSPLPPLGSDCLGPAPYPLPATEILRACGSAISAVWQFVRLLLP